MTKGIIIKKLTLFTEVKEDSYEKVFIKQSQRGNDDSFEKLMDIYEPYLYKMAFLYMKNEQDALDIYQETALKAYMNISQLRDYRSFKTWITRILINNVYEKSKKSNRFEEQYLDENIADFSYSTIEERIDLYDAIDLLDDKYRTPIILQYFYGLSIQQISEITRTKKNTVKTNIRRAKKKIYDILMEENDE
ncbi:sigma-70 family RNA polymerase sigma factor [Romboutsia lituseburensis]|uniref:RNA polymerase, sigma subunit, SigV n=1 Tax=Romboutsia lituseburensis DSM 797 TaxID=1121325 RepID=A0A1G9J6W2_9FIRM|nr:sigma-70 family RNA polymerase sigma factor [Romboutsia lituseburensis]CEH33606.1 RNA polymerase sigma factor, region 2 [Romboutsia lituseburensis]SDL33259.1 RNA polymerase, sigma subunit, SigV [Romboutsia lituseburensis DSM 797]